jgi:hypothetical protein
MFSSESLCSRRVAFADYSNLRSACRETNQNSKSAFDGASAAYRLKLSGFFDERGVTSTHRERGQKSAAAG